MNYSPDSGKLSTGPEPPKGTKQAKVNTCGFLFLLFPVAFFSMHDDIVLTHLKSCLPNVCAAQICDLPQHDMSRKLAGLLSASLVSLRFCLAGHAHMES